MKKFKFELTLTEDDLSGDEFWENALRKDGTGIGNLTEFLHAIIDDSCLLGEGGNTGVDVIKLIEYSDK